MMMNGADTVQHTRDYYSYGLGNDADATRFLAEVCFGYGTRVGNEVLTRLPPRVTGPLWQELMQASGSGGFAAHRVDADGTWLD